MKEFWLYLESYTFLWMKDSGTLIYNSLSGQIVPFEPNERRDIIFRNLLKPENMYCIKITEADLAYKELSDLVNSLRSSFTGDVVDADFQKPISLPPILSFHRHRERITKERLEKNPVSVSISLGNNLVKHLSAIYIYVNGECDSRCVDCDLKWRQTTCCTRSNKMILPDSLKPHFNVANGSHIHILGGDIAKYPHLIELQKLLIEYRIMATFYVNLRNINSSDLLLSLLNDFRIKLIVDSFGAKDKLKLEDILANSKGQMIQLLFLVSSESDLEVVEEIIGSHRDDVLHEIKPIYNGFNEEFLKNNVFVAENDFHDLRLSRRQIFVQQTININHFGKLTITSDGNVYSELSSPPVGTINDDIRKIVYDELSIGTGWFKIRDKKPCVDCIYQWLCPSPSNYEIVLSRNNLCTIC